MDLEKLYKGLEITPENPLCSGCNILTKTKPFYCGLDYLDVEQNEVLFLSDSLKYKFGKSYAFTDLEEELIKSVFPHPYATAAAVKCPSVKEADITPASMNICRAHLIPTIDKVKPKLVYACGNLAMKMLIKKSGITDKRGNSYDYETPSGHKCIVVPIFHPYAIINEPRHKPTFESDILNGYDKHIRGNIKQTKMDYTLVKDLKTLQELAARIKNHTGPIAVDIETTGLNFLQDKIMTVAIATDDISIVVPVEHKEFNWSDNGSSVVKVCELIQEALSGNSIKVLHNAKFDLKFLHRYGVSITNIADTKIMSHMINEEGKNSLKDLVKQFFPEYLEKL